MPRFLLFFCFFFLHIQINATPAFIKYDIRNGLPSNELYAVHCDRQGLIWIATDRGVVCYDGYRFQVFTVADGLTDNTVFQLYEDYRGRIWMITFNGRLCFYDNGIIAEYKYNAELSKYTSELMLISSLSVYEDGSLDIGYLKKGIIHVSALGAITIQATTALPFIITGLFEINRRGDLITSTVTKEPGSADLESGIFLTLNGRTVCKPHVYSDIKSPRVSALKRKDGSILMNVRNMMLSYKNGSFNEHKKIFRPVCFYETVNGELWIGTQNGVYHSEVGKTIDTESEHWFDQFSITSICEDKEGGIWLCTQNVGLIYIPEPQLSLMSGDELFPNAPFFTVYQDSVYYVDRTNRLHQHCNGFDRILFTMPGQLYQLKVDQTYKRLLCSTSTGFYVLPLQSVDSTHLICWDQMAYRLATPVNDTLCYIAGPWTLSRVTPTSTTYVAGTKRRRTRITSLCLDREKRLWVGSIDGLSLLVGDSLVSQNHRDSRLQVRINAIEQLQDGRLAMATSGKGVLIDNGKTIFSIGLKQGLPSLQVHTLIIDQAGVIWVSTEAGLCSIICEGDQYKINRYPIFSSFSPSGQQWIYATTEKIWLSNEYHFATCETKLLSKPKHAPLILIRSVEVNNSKVTDYSNSSFGPNPTEIRIVYAGLSYRLGGRINYRYRLNASENWIYTTSNEITFPFLDHGDYVFEVYAQNENGVWSNVPAKFLFTITPPFWKEWWFILFFILFFMLVITDIVFARIHQLKRNAKLRELTLDFRQQVLAAQMNPHFIFNAMNTIQSNILNANSDKAIATISRFSKLMRSNLEYVSRGWILLDEELAALKLYLEIEQIRFPQRLYFEINIDTNLRRDGLFVPPLLLQPLVENSVRHGIVKRLEGGVVCITIKRTSNWLEAIVEDNGVGREASARDRPDEHRSAGGSITAERLRVLCELTGVPFRYYVEDLFDKYGSSCGTRITLHIPIITDFSKKN